MDWPVPDPHIPSVFGAVPPWALPDGRKVWAARRKPGQSAACLVWPRDVKMKGMPWKSARRWKDVLTGKGPPMYVASRASFGPTKPTWSNWLDPELGNLGYLDERAYDLFDPASTKKYDFKKRRFTDNWQRPEVWSDVKWGRDKKTPLYFRDGWGREYTKLQGLVPPFRHDLEGNDFRHRAWTGLWDWTNPWPQPVWQWMDN